MRHLVLTRFSYDPNYPAKNRESHGRLLDKLCAASLSGQSEPGFEWVIRANSRDPMLDDLREVVAASGLNAHVDTSGGPWAEIVERVAGPETTLQTMLDSDDAVPVWFVERLQSEVEDEPTMEWWSFPFGAVVGNKRYFTKTIVQNQFLSRVCRPGVTAYDENHRRVSPGRIAQIRTASPAWAYWRHPASLTNGDKKKADFVRPLRELGRDFSLKWNQLGLGAESPPNYPVPVVGKRVIAEMWPSGSADARHVRWILDVLDAYPFRSTLEIGCLRGVSSTAFVESAKRYPDRQLHFCDKTFTTEFREVIAGTPNVVKHQRPSVELLRSTPGGPDECPWDFVFVDGNHRLDNVRQETAELMRLRPLCVMAHDTGCEAAGIPNCDGPPHLKAAFMADPEYRCLEDLRCRLGEGTHRGMFLAARSDEVFRVAQIAYRRLFLDR